MAYPFKTLFIIVMLFFSSGLLAQELVVSPTVEMDSMNINMVRAIFAMRLREWPDGTAIRVVVLQDRDPVHKSFIKKKLALLPHQLRRSWDRMVYSGTGMAPKSVETQDEILQFIRETPGSVGYLASEYIDNSVKLVRIVGAEESGE